MRRARHAVTPQPDPPSTTRWNATLWSPEDTAGDTTAGPYGIAWMAAGASDNHSIRVRIDVRRASPGVYAWRVHQGKCDRDLGVFGPPSVYRLLEADTTGRVSDYAIIPLGFPTNGQYFVRVESAPAGAPPLVCGNLVPPA